MRKTVLFIRFALCVAIGLVGSSVFATARAISVPNQFVKAQGLSVQKMPQNTTFATTALAAQEQPLANTVISSSILSQKITDPIKLDEAKKDGEEIKEVTVTPEDHLISAVVGAASVADLPVVTIVTPSATPPATLTVDPAIVASTQDPAAAGGGLQSEVLFAMINATRAQSGLPVFEKSDATCSMANVRAPEIYNEVFGSSYMHAGFRARNQGYSMNENIISIRTEQEAVNWWLNSPVHRASLLGNYKYSCISCSGNSCSEIFSN